MINELTIQIMKEFMIEQIPKLTREMWSYDYLLVCGPNSCCARPCWRKYRYVFERFDISEHKVICDINVSSWYNHIYKPGSSETSAKKIMDALELEALRWKSRDVAA